MNDLLFRYLLLFISGTVILLHIFSSNGTKCFVFFWLIYIMTLHAARYSSSSTACWGYVTTVTVPLVCPPDSAGLERGHAVSALHLPQRARSPVALQEPGHRRHADRSGARRPHLLVRRRRHHEDAGPPQPLRRRHSQQQPPPRQPQDRRQVLHIDT